MLAVVGAALQSYRVGIPPNLCVGVVLGAATEVLQD